ncbi:MAG TPA: molybdopterin dinucleotide binding domain-containing protein, partial [Burkholderiales bacterium]|nr:molybdopterin dinucleotide binding domain-containing protein [Burkholderiales bacterium]
GFEFNSSEEVRAAMGVAEGADISPRLANVLKRAVVAAPVPVAQGAIQRIGEVPIYQADPLVRRAESLLRTRDGADPAASMNGALMQRLGLKEGDAVAVRQGSGEALLAARRDDRLPDGCLRVPAAHPLTAGLGAMFGEVTAQKAEIQQRMAG